MGRAAARTRHADPVGGARGRFLRHCDRRVLPGGDRRLRARVRVLVPARDGHVPQPLLLSRAARDSDGVRTDPPGLVVRRLAVGVGPASVESGVGRLGTAFPSRSSVRRRGHRQAGIRLATRPTDEHVAGGTHRLPLDRRLVRRPGGRTRRCLVGLVLRPLHRFRCGLAAHPPAGVGGGARLPLHELAVVLDRSLPVPRAGLPHPVLRAGLASRPWSG